jgi:hypothetical protein
MFPGDGELSNLQGWLLAEEGGLEQDSAVF